MGIIEVKNLNFYYGNFQALRDVNFNVTVQKITALIGPSGCGKSTLLKVLNRMAEFVEGTRVEGAVLLDGEDIYRPQANLVTLRKRVGMVFQRPNPFPLSVFDNIVYGPRVHRLKNHKSLDELVEKSLKSTWLWGELKDHLHKQALDLSAEQQQRLCLARLLAVEPEVLLMDEPCSTLDPIATQKIEELMVELKKNYTILIVTHNMQQAARVSDFTGFMLLGELIEFGKTAGIFSTPEDKRTEEYITGRFG